MDFLSDKDVLHRAILANPDDPVVRGLYADELMVSGDPELYERGEIINQMLRCKGFSILIVKPIPDGKAKHETYYEYGPLSENNTDKMHPYRHSLRRFLAGIQQMIGDDIKRIVVRNGFIEEVGVGDDGWSWDFAKAAFESYPIKKVTVSGHTPAINDYSKKYFWAHGFMRCFVRKASDLAAYPLMRCELNQGIFLQLKKMYMDPMRTSYDTETEAFADLDQAIIQAGRNEAGLPKWEAK